MHVSRHGPLNFDPVERYVDLTKQIEIEFLAIARRRREIFNIQVCSKRIFEKMVTSNMVLARRSENSSNVNFWKENFELASIFVREIRQISK